MVVISRVEYVDQYAKDANDDANTRVQVGLLPTKVFGIAKTRGLYS